MSEDSNDDTMSWYARFDLAANEPTMVLLQIRMRVGSKVKYAAETLRPGQDLDGVSFEDMAARGSGWLILRDEQLVIQNSTNDESRR